MKWIAITILVFLSTNMGMSQTNTDRDVDFAAFELSEIQEQMEGPWLAFFKNKNVLAGIYNLKAGTEDGQRPHDTDEVYYVIEGQAQFKAGNETSSVKPGSILFVKAEVEHRFFDITEDLVILVFFDQ